MQIEHKLLPRTNSLLWHPGPFFECFGFLQRLPHAHTFVPLMMQVRGRGPSRDKPPSNGALVGISDRHLRRVDSTVVVPGEGALVTCDCAMVFTHDGALAPFWRIF